MFFVLGFVAFMPLGFLVGVALGATWLLAKAGLTLVISGVTKILGML